MEGTDPNTLPPSLRRDFHESGDTGIHHGVGCRGVQAYVGNRFECEKSNNIIENYTFRYDVFYTKVLTKSENIYECSYV